MSLRFQAVRGILPGLRTADAKDIEPLMRRFPDSTMLRGTRPDGQVDVVLVPKGLRKQECAYGFRVLGPVMIRRETRNTYRILDSKLSQNLHVIA